MKIFACTECPKMYCKYVLHLLKYIFEVQIYGKFWDTQYAGGNIVNFDHKGQGVQVGKMYNVNNPKRCIFKLFFPFFMQGFSFFLFCLFIFLP